MKTLYYYICSARLANKQVLMVHEGLKVEVSLTPITQRSADKNLKYLGNFDAKDGQLFPLATYIGAVTHQLSITALSEESEFMLGPEVGYLIHQLLFIKSPCAGFCFLCTDHEWLSIPQAPKNSIKILKIYTKPTFETYRTKTNYSMTKKDLFWATDNWVTYVNLMKDYPAYSLAAEIYSKHFQITNPRLIITDLWAGIEALCALDSGMRRGIALNLSYFLETRHSNRLSLYNNLRKLYDTRSSIVHGRKIEPAKMMQHTNEVRDLLSKTMKRCIDKKLTPTTENIFFYKS